ncbi:protein phosphatase 1 regulatory inhibitor subunit PPP1R7 homolog isoform X2 [Cryptomeria japonica]|uniref:protein phosphatase 1 regulatory inhibitor subunit PPP1R7 homolog isoform X2 n=1 Tax=Cryptomeria japonica TaxID=3369 RepID=UPI0025ACD00F|nr:protein phosphatase 1 regulatory inhibitor subunit PPP1R7 homolog isoform X2 [Cryptomeria japonica]
MMGESKPEGEVFLSQSDLSPHGEKYDEGNKEEDTILDLTSCQLHDLEEVELPVQLTEIDFSANRLKLLDDRIAHLTRLKKLSLRQNLFTDDALQRLSQWPAIYALQELVLRDNRLKKIPDISKFKDLVIFDVSFNEISSLKGMSEASPVLKELYLSKNELTKIEELDHLHQLRILELGSNRLRDCISLEELYLSHNGISKMEGLSTLVNLMVLDVSSNKLTSITGIENLARLEDLWLNDNQIASLDGIDSALAGSREKLTTIYLEHNPCAKDPSYISTLRLNFPSIQQIDSNIF